MTDARGWSMLYNGFSGENSKPMNPIELLPFPDEMKSGEDDEPRKVSEETERIARSLLKSEKLPPQIVAQIEPIL